MPEEVLLEDGEIDDSESLPKPKFHSPHIQLNPNGWGPVDVPESFINLPYQQFNKADKIGKVADWTGSDRIYQERRYGRDRYGQQYTSGQVGTQYAYYHDDEDATFQLVDSSRPQKTMMQRANRMKQQQFYRKLMQKEKERRIQAGYLFSNQKVSKGFQKDRQKLIRWAQRRGGGAWGGRGGARGGGGGRGGGGNWSNRGGGGNWGNRGRFDQQRQNKRPSSVQIRPEWQVLEEMDFPRLQKLNLPNIEHGTDIESERYGTLYYYEKAFDRVTTRSEKPLLKCEGVFYNVSTTDDPVIQRLARENKGTVFATDILLASLMCCTRSVYSWDIVAHRVGNKLFFDRRDNAGFVYSVDSLSVSETAVDPPADEGNTINSPKNLAAEALYVNQNFRLQVLRRNDEAYKFENPVIPFEEIEGREAECNVAYRYRTWNLGSGPAPDSQDVVLVCRTEHDGVTIGPNGETQFLTIKAFNEWDSRHSGGVDWRTTLDKQKGYVLATELKNNSYKLAKWTVQALLAASDQIKFGYVSRVHVRDSSKHAILSTQQYKPTEIATNITLNLDNAWGILRCLIDNCMKQPPGKYLIMKDPNKSVIRLYSLPAGTFEDSEESSSEEDEDEELSDDEREEKLKE